MFPFRDTFAKGIDAVVGAVEDDFAELHRGHIVHPWPCKVEGENVAEHHFVAPRSDEAPFVVLSHAEDFHLLFLTAFVGQQVFLEGPQLEGLLVGTGERRIASISQGDGAFVIDVLAGVGDGVAVVELPVTVVDDLHVGEDVLVSENHLAIYLDEDDGQVSFVDLHIRVGQHSAIVVALLGLGGEYGQEQHCCQWPYPVRMC